MKKKLITFIPINRNRMINCGQVEEKYKLEQDQIEHRVRRKDPHHPRSQTNNFPPQVKPSFLQNPLLANTSRQVGISHSYYLSILMHSTNKTAMYPALLSLASKYCTGTVLDSMIGRTQDPEGRRKSTFNKTPTCL